MDIQNVESLLREVIESGALKKLILSRSADKSVKKLEARLVMIAESVKVQCTRYSADNKALHENLSVKQAPAALSELFQNTFSQCNLFTTCGDCELKRSKKGAIHSAGRIRGLEGAQSAVQAHNREKRYLLPENTPVPFLIALGVTDQNGRVYDKKRAKFAQINRFLEMVRDAADSLPAEGALRIVDLCCGKSYLTFAVHYYFTAIKRREVHITGVDLKPDVIAYCEGVAREYALEGLSFVQGDILRYEPADGADLVISLHACNTATDVVLAAAVRWGARVILSSPCCHHELAEQMGDTCGGAALAPIAGYPVLRQRLCELATDGIRARLLEAMGYQVQILEFIALSDSPKNLLLRAVKRPRPLPDAQKQALLAQVDALCGLLEVSPTLRRLLDAGETRK